MEVRRDRSGYDVLLNRKSTTLWQRGLHGAGIGREEGRNEGVAMANIWTGACCTVCGLRVDSVAYHPPVSSSGGYGAHAGAVGSRPRASGRRFRCCIDSGVDDLVLEQSPAHGVSGRNDLSMRRGDCGSLPDPSEYLREDVSSIRHAGVWSGG